LNEALITHIFE